MTELPRRRRRWSWRCFTGEGRLRELVVAGRTLRTTPEHPFFVAGRGWITAGELEPAMLVGTVRGEWLEVQEIYPTGQSLTV